MNRFLKKACALFSAAAVLVTLAAPMAANAQTPEGLDGTNWMSGIEDDAKISAISIPGSHDSCTRYVGMKYLFQCQDTSITEQLEDGVRYLDIRAALDTDDDGNQRFKLIHNFSDCKASGGLFADKLYVDDVLEQVYAFLDENPSETVMFVVKPENSDDDLSQVEDVLMAYIDADPDYWYTENTIPTLGQVRGKVVLATRFEDVNNEGDDRTGLHLYWEDQDNKEVIDEAAAVSMINDTETLWVQDRYKYVPESKWSAAQDMIDNCVADETTMQLNFLSDSGTALLPHPKGNAEYINEQFMNTELKENTCYGIIIIDFVTPELAAHVWETNF